MAGFQCRGIHTTLHVQSNGPLICAMNYYYICPAFSRDNCTEGDVRISEFYSLHESITGLPEVCTNNSWNKLCGPDASDSVANVICRQLGFHGGKTLTSGHPCIMLNILCHNSFLCPLCK